MPGISVLLYYAAGIKRERVVAAADDDLAFSRNIDPIIAVAGNHRFAAVNGHIDITAAGDTDGSRQTRSPWSSRASW